MDDHYAYGGAPYEQGICLAGGPVLDSAGVYGVLIVRTFNEDQARALANADPSIKGGLIRTIVAEMILSFPPAAAPATSKP